MVGSAVTAQIMLADVYGNPITTPRAGQYNNSRLTIYGKLPAADFGPRTVSMQTVFPVSV
jgi:hypothetical protein